MSTPSANSVVSGRIDPAGDYRVDALLEGTQWGGQAGKPVSLDYSFPTGGANWASGYGDGEPGSLTALTPQQQAAAVNALAAWSAVANVVFHPVDDTADRVGDIRFASTSVNGIKNSQAYAYSPSNAPEGGDVWLNPSAYWDGYNAGDYGYMTYMHEVGHALGLSHPFGGSVSGDVLPTAQDSYNNSLMSYTALAGHGGSYVNFNPTTPMLYDIAAIQYLYGANTSFRAGDDTYTFYQGQSYYQTLWDGGGNDTIIWSATSQGATIDLRGGHWSDLGNPLQFNDQNGKPLATVDNDVAIYFTVTIENAVGGAVNDTLIGNEAANRLNGNGGNDTLQGNQGNDTLDGGAGIDVAVYNGAYRNYALGRTGTALTVGDKTGPDGNDTLNQVERLHFSDGWFAVDLAPNEPGWDAALLLGALAGPLALSNAALVGVFLDYFSTPLAGAATTAAGNNQPTLLDGANRLLALNTPRELAGSASNAALVNLLYTNITGAAPDAGTLASYTSLLDSQTLTQAQLLVAAAELPLNQTHVGLTGLAATGLQYTPPL